MSIRILVKDQVSDFVLQSGYRSSTGGSSDGMRGGYSYTVHESHTFSFENEKREDNGYSYDLRVVEDTDDYVRNRDMTETEEKFEENYGYIVHALRNRGISILNIPAYMKVKCEFRANRAEDTVEMTLSGRLYPVKDDTDVITASELIARVSEDDDQKKWMMIARSIGDKTLITREYHVALNSIPDELYETTKRIQLEKVTVRGLIEAGIADDADIKQALIDFAARANNVYLPDTDEIEGYIINLPEESRKAVLEHYRQSSRNIQLFRKYYPEGINWREVKLEEYIDSDLELIIQRKEYAYAYEPQQWEFIEHCMKNAQLERKVAEHAYILGRCNLKRIIDNLKECTTTDVLRSVLQYRKENPNNVIRLSEISCLFRLEYTGLTRSDYNACLLLDGDHNPEVVAFILKVGIIVGVSEAELVEMIHDKVTGTCDPCLVAVYKKFSFAPGLAWVQDAEDRHEAFVRQLAKERTDSNEKVVRLVQGNEKSAIRVILKHQRDGNREVYSPDGEHVGNLLPDEQRVILIEGKRYYYLVDVERAKKLHNGVFHLDVLEDDAGYVIGPKGSHIKETTEELNKLGCQIKTIKIHTVAAV